MFESISPTNIVPGDHLSSSNASVSNNKTKEHNTGFKDKLEPLIAKKNLKTLPSPNIINSSTINSKGINGSLNPLVNQKIVNDRLIVVDSRNIKGDAFSMPNGTEIARLQEYAMKMERYMYTSMWQAIYEMKKNFTDAQIGETLYGSKFIEALVNKAYAGQGGAFANSIYENYKRQQSVKS